MRKGNYCVYKKDGKEYSCGNLMESNIVIASENEEKMDMGFLKERYRNWRGEEEYSYYKIVLLEDLEDIYRVKYYMIVNGEEMLVMGYRQGEYRFTGYSEKEEKDFETYRVDIGTWDVYVPISKIEKFIEIKKHIGPFEYMGEERRNFQILKKQ